MAPRVSRPHASVAISNSHPSSLCIATIPCHTGPAGYTGDATSLSNCSMCELGYYQPIEGQVSCAKCPTDMHMTGIRGASHADDCSIPRPEFRPTLPVGCTPPGCLNSPTPADVYWTMESIDAPDGEEKTVRCDDLHTCCMHGMVCMHAACPSIH